MKRLLTVSFCDNVKRRDRTVVAVNTLEEKAHELLGHLGPAKLAAVVELLEAMVRRDVEIDEGDALSPAEAKAVADADEWLKRHEPIPHEQVLSELGLSVSEWERMSLET